PGEDMMDPAGKELFHDSKRDLSIPGEEIESRPVTVENFLMKKKSFSINVKEGLVLRVRGKERALNSKYAWRPLRVTTEMQRQCLPFSQNVNAEQLKIEHTAICRQRQT